MKKNKQLISLLCATAVMLFLLAGCGSSAKSDDLITPKSEPRSDTAGTAAPSDQDTQTETASQSSNGTAQPVESTDGLTEAQAKEIALNHAGLTEDQVTSLRVKQDRDNGRTEYEIEFWVDSTEYDYEIDAATGEILKHSAEVKAGSAGQSGSGQTITENQAKEIALNHAGLTEDQVTNLKVKQDRDNGRTEYEVEFRKDRTEYDYEIDTETGDILSYEIDVD